MKWPWGKKASQAELEGAQRRYGPAYVPWIQHYEGLIGTYGSIYKTQPALRTVVDFLARNISQLNLKAYRKVSDTDRPELPDHEIAGTIQRPNPYTTRWRFMHGLVSDLAIYDCSYIVKVRSPRGQLSLVRVPPEYIGPDGGNWLRPEKFTMLGAQKEISFPADDVIYFRGYNPEDPRLGLSNIETLRRILAEEVAAGRYREHFWQNAARMEGVIQRPVEAPPWTKEAREGFRKAWQKAYAGPENSGKTGLLEEGMEFKETSFNAKDSEYIASRKLSREEVARAYHIPLPMVGILDHATFSNIEEQHRNLYQDCLAPWLVQIQEELELQLLPEFGDTQNVYLEFNLEGKVRGSFQEQITSLNTAIGRPFMTPAEGRALMNWRPLDDPSADKLGTPLNILVGGQAAPPVEEGNGEPKALPPEFKAIDQKMIRQEDGQFCVYSEDGETNLGCYDTREEAEERLRQVERFSSRSRSPEVESLKRLRARHEEKAKEVLTSFFNRQGKVVLSKAGAQKASPHIDHVWDAERWDAELTTDLVALGVAASSDFGRRAATKFDVEYDEARTIEYITRGARISAKNINATTREAVLEKLDDPDGLKHVFEVAATSRADVAAGTRTADMASFGTKEAAYQAGGERTKTWISSGKPKSRHGHMNGETVPLNEPFSNGGMWPGDSALGVDETAGCGCSLLVD